MAKAPVKPTVSDLADQVSILKDDIANLTSALTEFGKAKTNEAAKTAQQKTTELAEASQAKALEAQAQAHEFVKAQPATALGLAALAGFAFGFLTSRR